MTDHAWVVTLNRVTCLFIIINVKKTVVYVYTYVNGE